MTNQSQCFTLVGVDDGKAHKQTTESMDRLGISSEKQAMPTHLTRSELPP